MKSEKPLSMPTVSIVVLNWNGEEVVECCIESCLNTRYDMLELIVVDNGSTDRSLEILRNYGGRIRLIELKENVGYVKGTNFGVGQSRGDFVVTLNNDIEVDPAWVGIAVDLFLKHPETGVVGCRQMDWHHKDRVDSLYMELGPGRPYLVRQKKEVDSAHRVPRAVVSVNGGSAIYRRQLWEELGGLAEFYEAYHEECDMHVRAWLHGWKCVYHPDVVVRHRGNHSFNRLKSRQSYLGERNKYLFILCCMPFRVILSRMPYIIGGEIADVLRFAFKGQFVSMYVPTRLAVLRFVFSGIFSQRRKLLNDSAYLKQTIDILANKKRIQPFTSNENIL